jgi:hypothetical protein
MRISRFKCLNKQKMARYKHIAVCKECHEVLRAIAFKDRLQIKDVVENLVREKYGRNGNLSRKAVVTK